MKHPVRIKLHINDLPNYLITKCQNKTSTRSVMKTTSLKKYKRKREKNFFLMYAEYRHDIREMANTHSYCQIKIAIDAFLKTQKK